MDQLFLTINAWMTSGGWAAAVGCLAWGVVSVALSPCHLASIPLIVAYVAGQETALKPRRAAVYAFSFTAGLFITIALVGLICAAMGLMLGDIGPYWTIAVGALLLWVAVDMMGIGSMGLGSGLLARLQVRGLGGAFVLGLAYGVLSGSCTFGFIAPILAVITVQKELASGILLIALFGLGHSLPIALAGSSTAVVGRLLQSDSFQKGSLWFRRLAGGAIALLGVYFIVSPFMGV